MSRTTTRDTGDAVGPAQIAAELGVLCAGLGTAASCSRLFIGWGFMATLAPAVAISWAVVVLARRARLGVAASAAITFVVAVLVLTWLYAPHTAFVGLPTPETARQVLDDMRASFSEFSELVAPVEASSGFLVALAAVLWAFTWFADTAAFRYRGPVQAVVPYLSAFVAVGVLSRSSGRTGAALTFGVGIAVYAVTQRTLTVSRRRWIEGAARHGTRVVAATGTGLVVVALLAGLALGPLLPGDTDAVLDLRSMGRQGGARTVVSPFVGVRALLGPQSDEVVFTVRSPVASYWRLTALGRYDPGRDIWVSQGTYREVDDGRLATDPMPVSSDADDQEFQIAALGGPWVPAAFVPRSIDGDLEVSFDAETSSIITRGNDLSTGDRYGVTSEIPRVSTVDLNASRRETEVAATYLDTAGVSTDVADAARHATLGRTTPYQQALALQDWFRDEFDYDTEVDYRDAADPVMAFLDERRGFCQQFASAYALMARSLGLPARVAVGFTPGDPVGESDGTTTFVVRGRHAHTWPEVHFDGVGWVPFEPTTQRGNPSAVEYTGVPPQQAPAPDEPATTTTLPTTTTAPDDAATSTVPSDRIDAIGAGSEPDARSPLHAPWWRRWWWALALAAAVVGVVLAVRMGRRRHRPSPGGEDADDPVARAWTSVLSDLATFGIEPAPSETPIELAERVASTPPFDGRDLGDRPSSPTDDVDLDPSTLRGPIARLAHLETIRRYGRPNAGDVGSTAATTARAAEARDIASRIRSVVTSASPPQRLGRRPVGSGTR